MTTKQRWWFILFTLPICALFIGLGLSSRAEIPNKMDLNLRLGNVWHNGSTYQSYSEQETFKLNN